MSATPPPTSGKMDEGGSPASLVHQSLSVSTPSCTSAPPGSHHHPSVISTSPGHARQTAKSGGSKSGVSSGRRDRSASPRDLADPRCHPNFGGPGASMPADYRPGRLNPLEILSRIFPTQKRAVLELVLQGCNGDLVKAIEHFLSLNDALMLHQRSLEAGNRSSRQTECPAMPSGPTAPPPALVGSVKSAFTPLLQTTPAQHAHPHIVQSPFSSMMTAPRAGSLLTDSSSGHFLGRSPFLAAASRFPPELSCTGLGSALASIAAPSSMALQHQYSLSPGVHLLLQPYQTCPPGCMQCCPSAISTGSGRSASAPGPPDLSSSLDVDSRTSPEVTSTAKRDAAGRLQEAIDLSDGAWKSSPPIGRVDVKGVDK